MKKRSPQQFFQIFGLFVVETGIGAPGELPHRWRFSSGTRWWILRSLNQNEKLWVRLKNPQLGQPYVSLMGKLTLKAGGNGSMGSSRRACSKQPFSPSEFSRAVLREVRGLFQISVFAVMIVVMQGSALGSYKARRLWRPLGRIHEANRRRSLGHWRRISGRLGQMTAVGLDGMVLRAYCENETKTLRVAWQTCYFLEVWKNIWVRVSDTPEKARLELIQEKDFTHPFPKKQWLPDAAALYQRAQQLRGRLAAIDGWTGEELAAMREAVNVLFHQLLRAGEMLTSGRRLGS